MNNKLEDLTKQVEKEIKTVFDGIGKICEENSKKVEDITSEDIINIYDALKDNIETLHVNDKLAEDIKNGKHLPFETKIDRLFVCSEKNEPIAIIERDHGKIFKVVRGLF